MSSRQDRAADGDPPRSPQDRSADADRALDARLPTVAVVGAASAPAAALVLALGRQARRAGDATPPVAIDRVRGRVAAAHWRLADPASPSVVQALGGVDVVIWIAADTDLEGALSLRPSARRELVVKSAHTLVTACAAAGVSRLIVVTSAQVYGAAPDNPLPLPEGFPLNGARDAGIVGDLLAVSYTHLTLPTKRIV